ncbi:hypothetical protein [Ectobacillus panaciterrae]|uniref:hypothetical protein n=1 Tax=Ectobacillus panaciterrae TaxID=363872 RepID=UPI0012DFB91D
MTWVFINRSWQGRRKDRLKMGLLGSSFYLFLVLFILYKWIILKPAFPGDDTFMAAIGLLFGMIVSIVAFITCFSFTAFSKQDVVG